MHDTMDQQQAATPPAPAPALPQSADLAPASAGVAAVDRPGGGDASKGQPKAESSSKVGAPARNLNRLVSGIFSDPSIMAVRFRLDDLPPSLDWIERRTKQFRASLEAATYDVHGAISVPHALAIQTASRLERHSLLCIRWLKDSHDTLSPAERLQFSKSASDASAARDKAIERLDLTKVKDPFGSLPRLQPVRLDPPAENTPVSQPEAVAGKPDARIPLVPFIPSGV